jgi:hypothetical protein
VEKEIVLFLGDSITRHYYPYAEGVLGESNIEGHLPDKWVSCQWKQMRMIDSLLHGKRRYNGRQLKAETVHFNFGLHSIKLPNKGHDPDHQRSEEKEFEIYENELNEQIDKLKSLAIRNILFTNTTPSPKNHGVRNDLDVQRLNEIAEKVMREQDVPHNDIYSFVKKQEDYPRLYMHPRAENNCHFLEHGRELLGHQVANFILDNARFE